jgi:hypothetical protein
MFSCQIDTDNLVLGLDSYREALLGQGKDAKNLVEDETRFLSRMITAFMPPIAKGRSAREIGEGAVERDLKNLISEAEPALIDEVGSKYGITDINHAYVTTSTGQDLNLQWEHLDPTGARLDEYHQQYKNKDGRIPKVKPADGVWQARVVVPKGTRQPYIDKIKLHVGHLKATWAKAGASLGDKYPRWISAHFGSSLGVVDKHGLAHPTAPSITFGSRAAGNRKFARQIQDAVKARVKALARKVKLVLSGYNADLAKGMRAQTRARNFREQPPNVD